MSCNMGRVKNIAGSRPNLHLIARHCGSCYKQIHYTLWKGSSYSPNLVSFEEIFTDGATRLHNEKSFCLVPQS